MYPRSPGRSITNRASRTRVISNPAELEITAVMCNVYAISPKLNTAVRVFSCNQSQWGIYHSGLEIFGTEYSFGGHPGESTGVQAGKPRTVRGARFIMQIHIGQCTLDQVELRSLIADLALSWSGRCYHPLGRNCNHFTAELSSRLNCRPPPSWVNTFSKSCLVHALLPLAECLARSFGVASCEQQGDEPGMGGSRNGRASRGMHSLLQACLALHTRRCKA